MCFPNIATVSKLGFLTKQPPKKDHKKIIMIIWIYRIWLYGYDCMIYLWIYIYIWGISYINGYSVSIWNNHYKWISHIYMDEYIYICVCIYIMYNQLWDIYTYICIYIYYIILAILYFIILFYFILYICGQISSRPKPVRPGAPGRRWWIDSGNHPKRAS